MAANSAIKEKRIVRLKEPKKYKVIMHNDDFTTMDFVVDVLKSVFHKNAAEAEKLMLMVHQSGNAVIAIYPYDIASTKVKTALSLAKQAGFPFKVTMEEA